MAVRKAADVAAYLELLRREPGEVRALYDDLLIKVTSFFRDEGSFEELKAVAFPEILKHKAPGAPIRAWVVGCATGEEVYSLAISLLEHLGDGPAAHPILIFGSDLDEKAIERARAGLYPEAAVAGAGGGAAEALLRPDRAGLARQPGRARAVRLRPARRGARPALLPARSDDLPERPHLLRPGPAAARPRGGPLLPQPARLPPPRSIGEHRGRRRSGSRPSSKGDGLFARKPGPSTFRFAPARRRPPLRAASVPRPGVRRRRRTDGALARHADDAVLERYGPPGVLVNDRLEVVQFRGRTGPYLEPPDGEPQSQLLKMARAGLAAPLRIALAEARRTSGPGAQGAASRIDGTDRAGPATSSCSR